MQVGLVEHEGQSSSWQCHSRTRSAVLRRVHEQTLITRVHETAHGMCSTQSPDPWNRQNGPMLTTTPHASHTWSSQDAQNTAQLDCTTFLPKASAGHCSTTHGPNTAEGNGGATPWKSQHHHEFGRLPAARRGRNNRKLHARPCAHRCQCTRRALNGHDTNCKPHSSARFLKAFRQPDEQEQLASDTHFRGCTHPRAHEDWADTAQRDRRKVENAPSMRHASTTTLAVRSRDVENATSMRHAATTTMALRSPT